MTIAGFNVASENQSQIVVCADLRSGVASPSNIPKTSETSGNF
jgi:hypothetical protein